MQVNVLNDTEREDFVGWWRKSKFFLKRNGEPFTEVSLKCFSKIVGFNVTPVHIRHLWCTFAGNSKVILEQCAKCIGYLFYQYNVILILF